MEAFDVLFLLMGAVMILAMHAGFAFLEAGTVSKKNQVNAFNKIMDARYTIIPIKILASSARALL